MKSVLVVLIGLLSSATYANALGFGISRSYFASSSAVLPKNFMNKELMCVEHMINGKSKKLSMTFSSNGHVVSDDDFIDDSKFTFGPYSHEVSASKNQTYPVGTGSIRIPGYRPVYSFMNARQVADTIFIELGLYPSSHQQNGQFPPISDMPKGAEVLSYISCRFDSNY